MIRRRNVKIIATLGPASDTPEMIRSLFDAGADVFRLNMSHLSHEGLRRVHGMIRAIEAEVERPIGILADLQGPKLRVGEMAGGAAMLEKGQHFRLDLDKTPGDARRAPLPHPEIFAAVEAGLSAYDGALLVVSHDEAFLEAIGISRRLELGG